MRKLITITTALGLALATSACGGLAEEGDASGDDNAATDASTDSSDDAAANSGNGTAELAMGNNSSQYANDTECDDPRFQGAGMAMVLNTDHIGQDANDCQTLLNSGRVELNPLFATPASDAEINYGDDSGNFPNDGDCDDIRFTGSYASRLVFMVEDIGHDASDCRNAVQSGQARWQGSTATPEYGVTLEELEEQGLQ